MHVHKDQSKDNKESFRKSFARSPSTANAYEQGHIHRPHYNRLISGENIGMTQKLYKMMQDYTQTDNETIQKSIVNHVQHTLARTRLDFKSLHCYQAVAHSVRDRLIEYFNDTYRTFYNEGTKKVYYLSLEFLIGRCLTNAVVNINLEQNYKKALKEMGYNWERIVDKQVDPALGNGGLGRLAACFLDSLATLNFPGFGYGIRYDYGIFKQTIKNGYQVQIPDFWLSQGNPWQIERFDVQYKIRFYGKTRKVIDARGKQRVYWQDTQNIIARAYDIPIPGYATFNTIGLRLWKSLPDNEFDFNHFNSGDYFKAVEAKQRAEYITSVLYPNDSTQQGKELRLKQEYLLCAASLQDIIRRDKNSCKIKGIKHDWKNFSKQAAIQLNDTHPALAIVQLLRILLDQQYLDHQAAWGIIYDSFAYTNHTVLPQALQKWSVDLLGKLLPRHLELIYLINHFWLSKVSKKFPDNHEKMNVLSLVEQSQPKKIRMANLCIVGSHHVNGVAALHSQLIKKCLFSDFVDMFPDKFINITNGVTIRRWILCANPKLAQLYTDSLGTDEWVLQMDRLKGLEDKVNDQQFCLKWRSIKLNNKKKLAEWVKQNCNVQINPDSMFDIQIKRIHQYKRQFMNILYVIWRYLWIKEMTPQERLKVVPRTIMFSGKAAPGYMNAKKIIKLINEVGYTINQDKQTNNYIKCLFLPNYCVSNAEIIIPATQLSQHISTAGTQASGTSNMKFVMNGGLIVGTMDGANVQIHEQVGNQNIFIFGARVDQIEGMRERMCNSRPQDYIPQSLKKVIQVIRQGKFGQKHVLMQLVSSITNNNDHYLVTGDFDSYVEIQKKIDQTYANQHQWTKMSILNAVRTGKFSSDRSIQDYADKVWNIKPCKVTDKVIQSNQ